MNGIKESGDQPTIPPNKARMADVEVGYNSHALIVYNSGNSKTPNNDVAVTSANIRTPWKHVTDKPQEPFSASDLMLKYLSSIWNLKNHPVSARASTLPAHFNIGLIDGKIIGKKRS
jgi:hypothetical protein